MTRTIAINVPYDVAQRLDREPNVSAFIAETVRRRMASERVRGSLVRESLVQAGFTVSDEGLARAAAELDDLHAAITPELRRQAAEVRAQISRWRGRPG